MTTPARAPRRRGEVTRRQAVMDRLAAWGLLTVYAASVAFIVWVSV